MNALATITYRVKVPATRIESLMEDQGIDESEERYRDVALDLLERDIADNPVDYLEWVTNDPDIEVDA
jgi:hypothetical protein